MNARIARSAAFALAAATPVLSIAAAPMQAFAAEHHASHADQLAVEKLERRWVADIAQGNRDDLAAILADDYRDIDWQGQVRDKQALLAGIHRSPATSQHITHLDVRAWGDTAVATGVNQVHSASKGWTVEVPFTDVFARIDGRWRAVSSQETVRKPLATRH